MTHPFDSGYYHEEELLDFGFRSVGKNVRIAKNNTIVGLSKIAIGDNVRIDGYCSILATGTAEITIGSHIHIAAYCLISAADGFEMGDFSTISHGVRIYSRSDDYSGETMTNPTVPDAFKNVTMGPVRIGRHGIVGSGTVILPGVTLGEGSSVGALSLVNRDLDEWGIWAGIPVRLLRKRSDNLLKLETEFIKSSSIS